MEENESILSIIRLPEVQEFMHLHQAEDAKELVLRYRNKVKFDIAKVAQQIELRQKAQRKLAGFLTANIVLLPKLYEQSTHEAVAKYKARFIHGINYLDATAGLGIDTFYLGKNFLRVVAVEADPVHAEILSNNYKEHNFPAEIHVIDIETFLKNNTETFSVVYIDPDRRPDSDQRKYTIEQCVPNLSKLKFELLLIAKDVWIKLSPMMDIHAIIQEFSPYIRNIVAIAYQNEMKELLVCLNSKQHDIKYTATNIKKDLFDSFSSFDINARPELSFPGKYFFEPNVALIKSRLCMEYAKFHHLKTLYPDGYFFTLDAPIEGLQGRLFEIVEVLAYKKELMSAFVVSHQIKKANISCRNFFWKPEQVKDQLKLGDGGEWYLFCYNNADKKPIAIWCKKISKA